MSEPLHSALHPDADWLAAFAEGSLPEHERARCLAHLAKCAQCREIVYLAREPVGNAIRQPAPVPTRWWNKRFLPIPAVAGLAALTIAGAIGIYRVSRPGTPPTPPPALQDRSSRPAPQLAEQAKARAATSTPTSASEPAGIRLAPAPDVKPPQSKPEAEPAAPGALPPPPVATEPGAPATAFLNAPATLPLLSTAPPALSEVTGTVTDSTGAVIARAGVNLRGLTSGDARTVNTDSAGQFNFAGLAPGRYEMQIAAPGFARSRKEIDLPPGAARADSVLSVRAATETVAVSAASPVVRAQSASFARSRADRVASIAVAPSSYVLPGDRSASAAATRGNIVLAADADGALFLSRNSGKSWDSVKSPWQGKVMQLTTPGSSDGLFRLTTDS